MEPVAALRAVKNISSDAVGSFIAGALAAGRLSPGDRLPTERELAHLLRLPRTAIRRSLAKLEAAGRIARHVGRGTYLTQGPGEPLTPLASATSPAEIMEVRLMLEPQIAALAASCATSAEFGHVRDCFAACEAAGTHEAFEAADAAFHRAIAASTHNEFLFRIFEVVNEVRNEPLWGSLKRRSFTIERRRAYEHDHRAIGAALEQRDAEAARSLMRTHIIRVRDNMLGAAMLGAAD
jgi:DNA-binding FadR family transcriptional regulator